MKANNATREQLEAFFHVYANCTNCKYGACDAIVDCCYPHDPIGTLFVCQDKGIKRTEVKGIERCGKWESHFVGGCEAASSRIVVLEACPNFVGGCEAAPNFVGGCEAAPSRIVVSEACPNE